MSEHLMTVPEAAELLTVSESTVWRLIRDGRLPVVRIGRSTRVRETDLNDILTDRENNLHIERLGMEKIRQQMRALGLSGSELVAAVDTAVLLTSYGVSETVFQKFLEHYAQHGSTIEFDLTNHNWN